MKLSVFLGLTRPRTLFSALSSVLVAIFYSIYYGCNNGESVDMVNAILLILIGSSAQICSNVANDIIDFTKGGDTEERKGPIRPLSKGLIKKSQVWSVLAVFMAILLLSASILIIRTSCYELTAIGALVLLGIFMYSGGPFPLSRNALGELSVLIFFGLIPTITSFYVLTGNIDITIINLSIAIGMSSCNILLVNNYRDYEEDSKTGKNTLLVKFGKDMGVKLYPTFGLLSIFFTYNILSFWGNILCLGYLVLIIRTYRKFMSLEGEKLNMVLGLTAINTFILALLIGAMLAIRWIH